MPGADLPPTSLLQVAPGGRTLVRRDGAPFFWLGDTAWLINVRLTREAMVRYLDRRAAQGYTVIQVMALHTTGVVNAYGNPAFPRGLDAALASGTLDALGPKAGEDYWETFDFLFEAAAARGIWVALVPVWGTVVQEGGISPEGAAAYSSLLARRLRRHPNRIWLNGGDIRGSDRRAVWESIGRTLKAEDPGAPVTFHPFGRTRSSTWFHGADWLDFHMIQSGHRDYGQRTPETEVAGEDDWFGEDNWKPLRADYALAPPRPTLDGEPSYEDIPHGLHDLSQPRWTAADCRRYAWWALLSGAFGHTYGHNSVMQFQRAGDPVGAYGAVRDWEDCLDDPGARQMALTRRLASVLDAWPLVPDDEALTGDPGREYFRRLAARSGETQVFYSYSGGTLAVAPGAQGRSGWWVDPRTAEVRPAPSSAPGLGGRYVCPGVASPGNDWLLVLEAAGDRPDFGRRWALSEGAWTPRT